MRTLTNLVHFSPETYYDANPTIKQSSCKVNHSRAGLWVIWDTFLDTGAATIDWKKKYD